MRKPLPTLALLAFGPGAALYFAPAPGRQAHPVWSVANWPFPMDQRGPGQRSLQSEIAGARSPCTCAPKRVSALHNRRGR